MDPRSPQSSAGSYWALAERQHGVLAHRQLRALGLSADAIKHRVATGRLHQVRRGVYALGRPSLSRHGHWMAAVLSCGPNAVLSHRSAAALWGILRPSVVGIEARGTALEHPDIGAGSPSPIEVSAPLRVDRRRPGIILHRRRNLGPADLTRHQGIPVTTPVCTPRHRHPGIAEPAGGCDQRD